MNKNFALFYVILVISASSLSAQNADTMKVIMTRGNIIVGDQGSDYRIEKGKTFEIYKRVSGNLEKIATAETKVIDSQKCAMVLTESNEYFPVAINDIILPQSSNIYQTTKKDSFETDISDLGIELESPYAQSNAKHEIIVRPNGYIVNENDRDAMIEKYGWSKRWIAKIDGKIISEKELYKICNKPALAMEVADHNLKSNTRTIVGILMMVGAGIGAYKAFTHESEETVGRAEIKYSDPQYGWAIGCTVLSSMGGTLSLLGGADIGEHFTDFETAFKAAEEYNNIYSLGGVNEHK